MFRKFPVNFRIMNYLYRAITFATRIRFSWFWYRLKALNLSFQTVQKSSKTDKCSESYGTIEMGPFSRSKCCNCLWTLKNKKRPDLLLARVPVRNIDKLIGASENPLFVNDWRERNSSTTETRARSRQTMYCCSNMTNEELPIESRSVFKSLLSLFRK